MGAESKFGRIESDDNAGSRMMRELMKFIIRYPRSSSSGTEILYKYVRNLVLNVQTADLNSKQERIASNVYRTAFC